MLIHVHLWLDQCSSWVCVPYVGTSSSYQSGTVSSGRGWIGKYKHQLKYKALCAMIGKQMTVFNDSFIMIYRHKYVFVLF